MGDDDSLRELLGPELTPNAVDDDGERDRHAVASAPPAALSLEEFLAELDLTASPEELEHGETDDEDVDADGDVDTDSADSLADADGDAAEDTDEASDGTGVGTDEGDVDGEELLALAARAVELARERDEAEQAEQAERAERAAAFVDAPVELAAAAPATPSPAAADPFASTGARTRRGLLLQYPSRDFPPPPVVRMEVPPGWLGTAVADAELAARAPEAIDGVYPNVVMRVRRVAMATVRDADLRDVLQIRPEGAEILRDEVRDTPAAPARRALVRHPGADGGALLARHLLVFVPATEHVASIVSLVATWPESADDGVAGALDAILASARVFMPQRTR